MIFQTGALVTSVFMEDAKMASAETEVWSPAIISVRSNATFVSFQLSHILQAKLQTIIFRVIKAFL